MAKWFSGEIDELDGDWICPEDGCDGKMYFNGRVWASFPAGYHHDCETCGASYALKEMRYNKPVKHYHKINSRTSDA